jgi:hypothetical protein
MTMEEESEADVYFAKALALYRELKPEDDRAILDLDDDDFDDMITFWSR